MHPDGILSDDLDPTSTYAVRLWLFVPADLASPHWDGRHGTLIVIQGRSGTPGTKRDRSQYAVQEFLNPGNGGRMFLLRKLDDPTPDETIPAAVEAKGPSKGTVHELYLGDGTLPARCNCDAAKAGLPNCKHRDAILAVIAKGGLPEPQFASEDEQP